MAAEKEALEADKKVVYAKFVAMVAEKGALKAKFKDAEARAEGEIRSLKDEAENAWSHGKEEFLKSSEFDDLCAQKSLAYFVRGFKSCLAQFRANGYTEEEHPTPFLSVARALEDLSNDEEEADDDSPEDEATPTNSPVL
ncbi:leucine zipper tumor suppressor 2-like [Dorcoceras hygrometricum]|uniref:Leucine zipper tumor suppressor 2-like n=1 Tax=Dorcoceras hygrometricum TaxID=472368 RepID=A0A2Z7D677_9LAMI|nr:leucine zipper tumor suppressor 2-like [Dorcoceras hygrometricum]